MFKNKRKGYVVERKIKILLEKNGWKVVRAGGSIGEADLVCIKNGKCIMLQIKSSKKKTFYYYGYMKDSLAGVPFYLVVDFGYGKIRVVRPMKRVDENFIPTSRNY
jgi:Holliday junction resolvase